MRKLTEDDIERLSQFLLLQGDDAMLPGMLDGFLAGIVICPETILPSEWLPLVWGLNGPEFEHENEANEIVELIMARYNEIAKTLLRRGRFQPIMELDTDEMVLWEIWAEGFARAIGLRTSACWDLFENNDDEDVRTAMGFLSMLATHALGGKLLDDVLDEKIRTEVGDLIVSSLETLNASRMASCRTENLISSGSIGRNAPCPCGSGKKFKKCCLN